MKPGAIVQPNSAQLPPCDEFAGLPDTSRDHVLHDMTGEHIGAHDDVVAGTVGVEQHQAKRITAVEVPDLVEVEPMEQRAARRIAAVQPDHRRADRPTGVGVGFAAICADEERRLDRQRRHAESFDQLACCRVHVPVTCPASLRTRARRASRSTSPLGRPINCMPIGRPRSSKPTGTLIAGSPANVA